jgi:hypothetical protein
MGHADRLTHDMGRWIGAIGRKDTGSLDPTHRFGARTRDPFQLRPIVCFNRDIDDPPRCCHDVQPWCLDSRHAYNIWRSAGHPHKGSISRDCCTSPNLCTTTAPFSPRDTRGTNRSLRARTLARRHLCAQLTDFAVGISQGLQGSGIASVTLFGAG